MKQLNISVHPDSRTSFQNNAAYCVGTGRMGLALQEEYQKQLSLVQELAHFKHIRGHGLFHEDMSIYQAYTDPTGVNYENYCFTYLDRVMDSYLEKGLKPFLELGFMPKKMASGTQTIFYWAGNVTPPADDQKWVDLVKATLTHLAKRYGEDEVSTWPCEVWNEPNLPGFWENADKPKYLHLYAITVKAIKEVLPRMRVGGPAICGGAGSQEWVEDFLTFCRDEKLPLDFVTRHAYMGQTPERNGRYLYHEMCDVNFTYEEMKRTREIIDSFPEFKGMEMHITEFNTSYNPLCPIHDTNLNACYIAGLLSCLGDVAASYSYWTFGDVFEELGVPSRPFHGGFGMVANQNIIKPTMWTFAFFNNLTGECVHKDEHSVIMRRADGSFEGVLWNLCRNGREDMQVHMQLPISKSHALCMSVVDEECTNPLKCWHEMGEPADLTREQLQFLRQAGQPMCESKVVDGEFDVTLRPNALVHFTLTERKLETDEGYDYTWYLNHA